jgi:hypothetical protein
VRVQLFVDGGVGRRKLPNRTLTSLPASPTVGQGALRPGPHTLELVIEVSGRRSAGKRRVPVRLTKTIREPFSICAV